MLQSTDLSVAKAHHYVQTIYRAELLGAKVVLMGFQTILWRFIGGISLGLTLAGVVEAPMLTGTSVLDSGNPWNLMLNMTYMLGEALRHR